MDGYPADRQQVRQLVGMVFQDADSQIVGETVAEDVAFGPENLGLSVSRWLPGCDHVAEPGAPASRR